MTWSRERHAKALTNFFKAKTTLNKWLPAPEIFRRMRKGLGAYSQKTMSTTLNYMFSFAYNVSQKSVDGIHAASISKTVLSTSGKKEFIAFYYFSETKPESIPVDIGLYQKAWNDFDQTQTGQKRGTCGDKLVPRPHKKHKTEEDTTTTEEVVRLPIQGHPMHNSIHNGAETTSITGKSNYTNGRDTSDRGILAVTPPTGPAIYATMTNSQVTPFPFANTPMNLHPCTSYQSPLSPKPPPPQTVEEKWDAMATLYEDYYGEGIFGPGDTLQDFVKKLLEKKSSQHTVIAKATRTKLEKCQGLVNGVKAIVKGKQCKPTDLTRRLWAAYTASHPQVAKDHIERISSLAVYAFWQEVLFQTTKYAPDWSPLFTISNISNATPSGSSLHDWRIQLATENLMIMRPLIEKYRCVVQTDGGPTGQEIIMLTVFIPGDNSHVGQFVRFWLGTLPAYGKTSDDVADVIMLQLRQMFGDDDIPKILGLTSDSGAGTPESLAESLKNDIFDESTSFADSCGLHDTTSIVRLALQEHIGDPGLDKNNGQQYLHCAYSLYETLHHEGRWLALAKALWTWLRENKPELNLDDSLPEDLQQTMQQPLITRWWTVGVLAALVVKYFFFFEELPTFTTKWVKSKSKANTIAVNMQRYSSRWNLTTVCFIAAIFKEFVDRHMKWYQGSDPLLGNDAPHGYLSLHRTTRLYIMLLDMEKIQKNWKTMKAFSKFKERLATLRNEEQQKAVILVEKICGTMIEQCHKHNDRYGKLHPLLRSCFAEKELGQIVANHLLGNSIDPKGTFDSVVHKRQINLKQYSDWMLQVVKENPIDRDHQLWKDFKNKLHKLVEDDGIDIWAGNLNMEALAIRNFALERFAALASTQHHVERHVKHGTNFAKTGKSEKSVNASALASNFVRPEHKVNEEEASGNDSEETEEIQRRKRVKVTSESSLTHMITTLNENTRKISQEKQALADRLYGGDQEAGQAEYKRRYDNSFDRLKNTKYTTRAKVSEDFEKHLTETNPTPGTKVRPIDPDFQPSLLDYLKFSAYERKIFLRQVHAELQARGFVFPESQRNNKKNMKSIRFVMAKLKDIEKERYIVYLRDEARALGGDPGNRKRVKELQIFVKAEAEKKNADGEDNSRVDIKSEWSLDITKVFKPVNGIDSWKNTSCLE